MPDSDSAHWEQIQHLFHLADSTPESERETVLAAACPDPELRRRALALYHASTLTIPDPPPPPESQFIGPYRLIRHLGSGGMGAVYEAEKITEGILQRSAVKVLALHAAGPLFTERFQRERTILASLDHPAITRMLDAGVDASNRPYLSMEFVDGLHLDAYCDQHTLPVPDRLQLFLQVCDAVDYAHRNLVVHLDLKPSNILVTPTAAVKLLDFGTSKLIDTDGRMTFTISATPAYASPEQLRSEPVTTSCDIYSLGAILFELLSGRKLTGDASVSAIIEQAVAEREPDPVEQAVTPQAAKLRGLSESRLRTLLQGDLATIVRKSLSPRPQDRYASVSALSDDIHRYLDGRPVLARRQTTLYHLQKFIRRNRGLVVASALVAAALFASLAYAWYGQQQALREGQRAVRMQTFLYRLFEIANSNFTGKPAATVKDFLQLGVKALPEYIRDPSDLRQAQLALAQSMYWNHDYAGAAPIYSAVAASAKKNGDIASEAEAASYLAYLALRKGATDEALSESAHALALSRNKAVPPQTQVLSQLNYALVREQSGHPSDENLRLIQSAAAIARQNHLPPHEIGQILYFWGAFVLTRGRIDEADQHYHDALAAYQQDPLAVCEQASVQSGLANVLTYRNQSAQSVALFKQAYEGSKACNGPDDTQTLRFLTSWANSLVKSGHQKEAITMLEASLPAWNKKIPRSSPYTTEMFQPLGRAYIETGRFKDAQQIATDMLDSLQQAKFPPNHKYFGFAHLLMGQALAGQGKYKEALPEAQLAAKNLSAFANTPNGKNTSDRAQQLLDQVTKN